MQIGILHMPQATGLPVRRQIPISVQTLLKTVDTTINRSFNFSSENNEILLGSNVTKAPNKLFKSINVCSNKNCIIETVFSLEKDVWICLYTKVVGIHTTILISLNGINNLKNRSDSLRPLYLLVAEKYWRKTHFNFYDQSKFVVDPIFEFETLNYEVLKIVDQIETGGVNTEKYEALTLLYEEAPSVLNALISGSFLKSPFQEINSFHPFAPPQEDKWFLQATSLFTNKVKDGIIHFNQQELDVLVHRLVSLRPSKISLGISINHAIDGLLDLGIIKQFHDPYSDIFGPVSSTFDFIKKELQDILTRAVFIYCQIYDIDYQIFLKNDDHRSTVSISKNIYDEVTIEFHDHVNYRHVSFYSYYPLLCLGTWGVGETINYARV